MVTVPTCQFEEEDGLYSPALLKASFMEHFWGTLEDRKGEHACGL